jgi:hypothetical protein
MSGLSDEELEELEQKIIDIVCEERPSLGNRLESSTIHDRLVEEGTELPDYAMADALDGLKGALSFFLGGPQNPNVDTETVRRHGGITIVGIKFPEICNV